MYKRRQSVFTLSLSLRLNYVMWRCKCECITESSRSNQKSDHLHSLSHIRARSPSFDSQQVLYCWNGTNIAEFASRCTFHTFLSSHRHFYIFVHSRTNFSLKYLFTRICWHCVKNDVKCKSQHDMIDINAKQPNSFALQYTTSSMLTLWV